MTGVQTCALPISLVPGVQQAASGPDPGPVAGATALGAIEDMAGGIAAEHGDQAVVHIIGPAGQQGDAAGDEGRAASAAALGRDALPRREGPASVHGFSITARAVPGYAPEARCAPSARSLARAVGEVGLPGPATAGPRR